MLKKDKCVTDGCCDRKEYLVIFNDGVRGNYCGSCMSWMKASSVSDIKSVKALSKVESVKV